jgi:MYXO-CTERM domain-containing protein
MEDTIHGAYCPADIKECAADPGYVEDNYHRCFDIILKKGATNGPGASRDPVSLPADKKYVDCSKQAPSEPTEPTADAGNDPAPTESDAGEEPAEPTDDDSNNVDGETTGNSRVDAGVKKDAGTVKKDAGKATDDSDDEEATPAAKEDGCALASSPEGATWTLLALGALLARRRRRA